jgi:putative ABC transport system ATP-binding protein
MNPATVLELRQVGRVHTGPPTVTALRSVSLRIEPGELVAVTGPSGSGKSTLLHVAGTLERPTSGAVLIDGEDTANLPDRHLSHLRSRHIGFVFQQFLLLLALTALDNVAAGLLYRGTARRDRAERAANALDLVGLAHRLTHRPAQLSGGEQQRVAIARAIVGDPAFVLADEPTGNLDSSTGAEIIQLLRTIHATGTTIIVVTHDHDLAASLPRHVELRYGTITRDTPSPPCEA